ncbi:ABC transporter ATP-binding protein [Phreatobacter sp.]|uniref:ABC transporter ATP-binding protein n=1 Tax=Phreatobacter sp. TaxID=1966341 RepID=UPI0025E353F3|nr:ABC transporter ATP-binding protein [Phreatobacter sp.]
MHRSESAVPLRPFVELTGVSHTYATGGTLAVDGLDIRVNEGEFAAVVGPSGCGKSTLMKLATGLQFPQAGAVVVDGQEVRDPVKIAGMAFQAPTLLPWRTTLENLMLPLEIVEPHRSRLRRHKAEYVAKAEALLASVGLEGAGSKFPWQLSGGMQQRASLCRALIHEPKLLMLDEPFGALDAFTREELWCVIRDLHARMAGTLTVILVTHDLREAVFLADRIFCMSSRPGKIIAEREVAFPRPRDIEITYKPEFSDIVHDLRGRIAHARSTA